MKTMRTQISLLFTLVLFFGYSNSLFSQNNELGGTGQQASSTVYIMEVSAEYRTKATGELRFGADNPNITFSVINPSDFTSPLIVELNIPGGIPASSFIELDVDGLPQWHVTVADILGNTQNDDVVFRPAGNVVSQNDHSTSIVIPPGVGGSNPGSAQSSTSPKPKVNLYPNPASDILHIVTEGEILWGVTEILDLTGKKMAEFPIGAAADRTTLNLSSLRPGVYIIRFRTDNEVYAKKIQVTR